MITVLQSIQKYLNFQRDLGVAPDLLARWTPDMETQVNVFRADGRPVEDTKGCYQNESFRWCPIRVPKNAKSEPIWNDYAISWPLDLYAQAIGSTWWNWRDRTSEWLGFDFDALVGHAVGVGVSDAELAVVKAQATALPYVEVRSSTGGQGLHLYVPLDKVPTENHTVHAALGRCVLEMMSVATGFDFASRVDCCGGNMWMWRRGLQADHAGLKLIKPADQVLTANDLPSNWRDHIEVVTKRRVKVRLRGLNTDSEKGFETMNHSRRSVALDDGHRALIDALLTTNYTTNWIEDHKLLQTHTVALKEVYDRQSVPVKGLFSTTSPGDDPSTPNCFLFPLPGSTWKVVRFQPGTSESKLWDQDGEGWTSCKFNCQPTLAAAALELGGVEDPDNGEFVFDDAGALERTVAALGFDLKLPQAAAGRELRLSLSKKSKVTVKIKAFKDEPAPKRWFGKNSYWIQSLGSLPDVKDDSIGYEYDSTIRQLVSCDRSNIGWVTHTANSEWCERLKSDAEDQLFAMGVPRPQLDAVMGCAVRRPWKIVNLPFQPEYPGERLWNRDSAQLVFQPAVLADDQSPHHPHWNMVLNHLGADLDESLQALPWAAEAHIYTGGDYLKAWMASMYREPFEPLPYLFFFGPEEAGKSLFHEANKELMTTGVVDAYKSLASATEFNGELANAVLCFIDEKDLKSIPGALQRIKQWVTGTSISIRKMRMDAYQQPNTTHWIQCANKRRFCPVFPGDTRITMAAVGKPQTDIPKAQLLASLRSEAPHFMRSLMDLQLPERRGRLRIPVVDTKQKKLAAEQNECPVSRFIAENCDRTDGYGMLFSEFFKRFDDYLSPDQRGEWTQTKVALNLPDGYETRKKGQNKSHINAAWKNSIST